MEPVRPDTPLRVGDRVRRATIVFAVVAVLLGSGLLVLPSFPPSDGGPAGHRSSAGVATGRSAPSPTMVSHRTTVPVSGAVHNRIATVPLRAVAGSRVNSLPAWLTYDRQDRAFYIAVPDSSVDIVTNVTWFDSVVAATIPVGTDPFGVAYDDASGDVFVTNTGSDNVSVLSGFLAEPVASIAVGASPTGIAYDPVDDAVYVANSVSNTVTVIDAASLRVIATVNVGAGPIGVAADPSGGNVYVADKGSDEVTVIAGADRQVLATVSVGAGPIGVAVDNASDTVYVSNEISHNVSAISELNDTVVATISASPGVDLQGIVFDWEDGLLWLAGGQTAIVVMDPATATVVSTIFFDPSGIAFDPVSGNVCATNSANASLACVLSSYGTVAATESVTLTASVPLEFYETGLPTGTSWELNVTPFGATYPSEGGSVRLSVYPTLSYGYSIVPDPPYWASPSSGLIAVGTVGATVDVRFANTSTYPVNFSESGLPLGTVWYANVTGEADLTGTTPSIGLSLGNGTYNYTVATYNKDYQPAEGNGSFTVVGTRVLRSTLFSAAPLFPLSFTERGLPEGADWEVLLGTLLRSTNGTTITDVGPNATYTYGIGPVAGYSAYPTSGTFLVDGRGATIVISFEPLASTPGSANVPPPFELFGLPGDQGWFVLAGLVALTIAGAWALGYVVGRRRSTLGHRPPTG